jgi:hypothetical protein
MAMTVCIRWASSFMAGCPLGRHAQRLRESIPQ